MTSESKYSALKGHLAMVVAITAVVAVFTLLDVQISLARVHTGAGDVHLAQPEVAYFFISVLVALIATAAVIINSLLRLVLRRRISETVHWAALGAAFALISIAQPVSAVGINDPIVLWLSAVLALGSAMLVTRRYGVRVTGCQPTAQLLDPMQA